MENNSNHLNLVIPSGVNQIYTFNNPKISTVNDIISSYFDCKYPNNNLFNIISSIKAEDYSQFLIILDKQIQDNLSLTLNQILDLFKLEMVVNNEDFYSIDKKILYEVIGKDKSNINRIILIHENYFEMIFEKQILSAIYPDIIFLYKLKEDLRSELSINPQNYLIFHHNLKELVLYKESWRVYLTNFIFISLNADKTELNRSNIQILNEQGKFFNFSAHFFYGLRNYYYLISEVNQDNNSNGKSINDLSKTFNEKLNELNPIRILMFYRIFFKKGEMKKADHYTSNEKVFFISHIGGLPNETHESDVAVDINGRFDGVITRISDCQDFVRYSKFLDRIENYSKIHPEVMLLNSNKNLINVNKRDLMIEFLLNFCNCAKLKTVQEKYSTEVLVPHCYPVEYKEIYELYQFENFINEKNLTLPLIIKYSGPRTDFNHLLITIITPEGLSNYVEFFKNYAKGFKDEISMVIQSYVNHGGYVIKLYRISDKAVIYLRPSLPDVTEELTKTCEEYSKGYYQIYTNDLVTPEYKKFWMKLSNNDKIKISKNDEFLDKIAKLFEDYSEMSLFGLDFLYDIKENKYYVVDVNYFPGYKELVPEFNDVIIDHVVKYFKIFKENGKIFNI